MSDIKRPAVLLVSRAIIRNSKGEILFVQRAADDNHDPGLWEAPGGKLEEGQNVAGALGTEVFQETRLVISPLNQLVYHENKILTSGKYAGSLYIVLFVIATAITFEVHLSHEHQDFKWLSREEGLDKLVLTEETRNALLALEQLLG